LRRRGLVDFLQIIIRDGKGAKDWITMLPEALDRDLAENWGHVQMPDALDRK
jgi:hypothetical protein